MSNFNLRKFLIENGLTSNSRLLKELRLDGPGTFTYIGSEDEFFKFKEHLRKKKLYTNARFIHYDTGDYFDTDKVQNRREEWIYDWVEENGGAPLIDVFEWIYENRRPANKQELVDEFHDYFKLPLSKENVLDALVAEYLYHFDYV